MTSTITVIILTKNEEENIKDCIATVQFADEVLVIDDFSTDHTVPFAKTLGARCVQHALDGDWGKQRRFGISQAKSDWIVFWMQMNGFRPNWRLKWCKPYRPVN